MAAHTPRHSRSAAVRAAGFSMVELLVAIAVLLIGVVAVAQLVPTAIQSNYRNRYDSTALIIAQRQLELLATQDLRAGNPPINGTYFFNATLPDGTPTTYNLGVAPPCFVATACVIVPPAPTTAGAGVILIAGNLGIDWGQAAGAVPVNYRNVFMTPDAYLYETRWNVMTFYGNFNGFIRPVGKRLIISTRGGAPGTVFLPATLVTMVAWAND